MISGLCLIQRLTGEDDEIALNPIAFWAGPLRGAR